MEEAKSIYDYGWGEYGNDTVVEQAVEKEIVDDDYNIEEDDNFDYSQFQIEDEYEDVRKDPVLREWIPITTYSAPSSIEEEEMYKLAKAWYSGSHLTPDNVIPGKSAGNKLTTGEYANKVVDKFRKTNNWKTALGAAEGPNNKLDTPTNLNSSALGRLQIIKGTRYGAYAALGIPKSQYAKAEEMYRTDADFQSQVEDAVYNDMMGRINKQQFGGFRQQLDLMIPEPDLDVDINDLSGINESSQDFDTFATLKKGANILSDIGQYKNDQMGNYASLASDMIDGASDVLANKKNAYNLRKMNKMKNEKKYLFNPVQQNNVPIYT